MTPALNAVFVSSRKNMAMQTWALYLPKAQTGHCSFWVWQGRRMGGKPSTCLLPQTAASSVSVQVPPEDISNASRVSRGIKTPHLISKTQRNTDVSFAAATNTQKNNRGWLLYDCHTHTQKKPTLPHVITPSEKTSCYGLCRAS